MQKNPVRSDTDTKDKAALVENVKYTSAIGNTESADSVKSAGNTENAAITSAERKLHAGNEDAPGTDTNAQSENVPKVAAKEKSGIAYQNKDIFSKIFGEGLKEKSFAAYGLDVPKIAEVLPTNLPAVEANELRLDNLFRFADDSLGLTDYESTYDVKDKVKYLGYIVRVLKHNSFIGKMERKIRMIVIYTGDIFAGQTKPDLHIGCLDFKVEEVFLSNLDAPAIEAALTGKLERNEQLTEAEQMKFIILPLAYQGLDAKQACIRRLFEVIKRLPEGKMWLFLLSGMLVFTDKVIKREDSEYMKGWINMTQIGRLYAEEMREALLQKEKENEEALQKLKAENKEIEKVTRRLENSIEQTIVNLFGRGFTAAGIHEVMPDISLERIEAMKV